MQALPCIFTVGGWMSSLTDVACMYGSNVLVPPLVPRCGGDGQRYLVRPPLLGACCIGSVRPPLLSHSAD